MYRSALVLGGNGAMGRNLCLKLLQCGWSVSTIDIEKDDSHPCEGNPNYIVGTEPPATMHNLKLIVNAAGGWAGDTVASADLIKTAQEQWNLSVRTSLIAAHYASRHMQPNGLLCFFGADAALSPTPTMISYGIAKAGVHHLVKSLAQEGSELPKDVTVAALLPKILDTPANRKAMPSADFSSWTKMDQVSELIINWAEDPQSRPKNGSLVRLTTTADIMSTQIA